MSGRILVIRGGAIGDFILTLPAIKLLREAFPNAHLEIIGYRHIVALAEGRFYADATRSIEYGPLAGFFARRGTLSEEMTEYFASFQQVISYLFDPDGIFEANLRRAGVKNYLPAFTRVDDSQHAAQQLALPLQRLALFLEDPAATIHFSADDHAAAEKFLGSAAGPMIAIHPGSGSVRKNWPVSSWAELGDRLLVTVARSASLGGWRSRSSQLRTLQTAWGRTGILANALRYRSSAPSSHGAPFSRPRRGIRISPRRPHAERAPFGPTDPPLGAPQTRTCRSSAHPTESWQISTSKPWRERFPNPSSARVAHSASRAPAGAPEDGSQKAQQSCRIRRGADPHARRVRYPIGGLRGNAIDQSGTAMPLLRMRIAQ